MSQLKLYDVYARNEDDGDWSMTVSAHSPEEAVRLYRAYAISMEFTFEDEDYKAFEGWQPARVYLVPDVGTEAKVHEHNCVLENVNLETFV